MSNLFAVLFFLSMVAAVGAMINPQKALFFLPKKNRKKRNVVLIFGLIMLIALIGVLKTADNTNIREKEEVTQEVRLFKADLFFILNFIIIRAYDTI